jgi:hypothetical protein
VSGLLVGRILGVLNDLIGWLEQRLPSIVGSFMQLIDGFGLLGCDALSLGRWLPTFRWNVSQGASEWRPLTRRCHTPKLRNLHSHSSEHLRTLALISATELANSSTLTHISSLNTVVM